MEEVSRTVRKSVRRFPWKLFLSVVLFVLCASAGAVFGLAQWMSRDLPDVAKLAAIRPPVRSTVYDVKGREIAAFFKENRDVVPLKAIPKTLVDATLSTEDRHFYSHWGVDLGGITRAALTNVLKLQTRQGGSTITQQLARNLFLTHERTLDRKFKELVIALRIEKMYSKQEILEMYFNQIYYGHGAYGAQAAARTFFGKDVRQLTLTEAALVAGLPQNPSGHSPYRNPQSAINRRNVVLRNMLETKTISPNQYEAAVRTPLGVIERPQTAGLAPYFVEMVRLALDEKYGSNLVYEGGLKVYTSLDLDLQREAERSLERQLTSLEQRYKYRVTRANWTPPAVIVDTTPGAKPRPGVQTPYLQGAFVALDARTGYVRALIGGRDFKASAFNRAVQAKRQPGSAFKPFIYTAAIDNGFQPTDIIEDAPISLPGGANGAAWTPGNYDHKYSGPVTLRYALQRSINIPAIKLLKKLGVSLVASYARRMGIRSPIHPNLSVALGTSEVDLIEITSAYSVLANEGIRNEPAYILKVEDKSGAVLESLQPRPVDVLSAETAGVMTNMLQSVMDHGTGYPARGRGFTAPAAGKTGTTDDYSDAWFVGFTPEHGGRRVGGLRRQEADGQGRHRRRRRAARVDRLHDLRHARPPRRAVHRSESGRDAGDLHRDRAPGDRGLPHRHRRDLPARHRADRVLQRPRRPAAPAGDGRAAVRLGGAARGAAGRTGRRRPPRRRAHADHAAPGARGHALGAARGGEEAAGDEGLIRGRPLP